MLLIEIAAGLFIVSWILSALCGIVGFMIDHSGGPSPCTPSYPGEWKDGLRNMAIIIAFAVAICWLIPGHQ